ncbi:DUF1800 family protein [Tropicimonas sp. IMCC34011]|uniref:DUF1800 domain-containing protein n=1 Tax=Tropicimonas sp. IMCC34011 TaxID=2248759 RepID=UPI000E282EA9|nr:DUF1800 domain-containing protein [Tropicimonas sp. IMCC34011]
MTFQPEIAAIRFGTGLGPTHRPPTSPEALLRPLAGPDDMAALHPIPRSGHIEAEVHAIRTLVRQKRDEPDREEELDRAMRARRDALRDLHAGMAAATFARAMDTADPFRERLVQFWQDHFTVLGMGGLGDYAVAPYIESAIRPHLQGRFADMLRAVIQHPVMLLYLDQNRSVGPNSVKARRGNQMNGMNENLARELLELHTLGVGAGYDQGDVRQLAELLAGLGGNLENGFRFFVDYGEPGPETVVGRSYGRRDPKLEDIHAVLEDLSVHPETARHMARKLAVHFVSDVPDPALVDHMAARWADTGGELMTVYEALLEHPSAQEGPLQKAKLPFGLMTSAFRALGLDGARLTALDAPRVRRLLFRPLAAMGQPWQRPLGPDGWPEAAERWITPQGLAARITWAMDLTRKLEIELPDPRDFLTHALGTIASEETIFAAHAAETVEDGVALVICSPDFQRR